LRDLAAQRGSAEKKILEEIFFGARVKRPAALDLRRMAVFRLTRRIRARCRSRDIRAASRQAVPDGSIDRPTP
jgi:hypothetical protein